MRVSESRSLLLVSYHFPPVQGSSGVQRILSFAKYLPEYGWQPTVLSISTNAYPGVNWENSSLVPDETKVVRSLGFDAARQFSVFGRYPGFLAIPDRWQSWIPFAVVSGLRIVRRQRPAVIMSSFPIASAHIIARTLHRRTGIPWVADLRDPMVLDNHPPEGRIRKAYESIEQSVVEEASRIVVTTPGAASLYRNRYPTLSEQKVCVVENGFDEEVFARVEGRIVGQNTRSKLKILHSGLVYREARDPRPLFQALSQLITEGAVRGDELEIVFRASGQDTFISAEAQRAGLGQIVKLERSLSYEAAVAEMMEADSLLLLQSVDCNSQIPAKAYEYARCRRPMLALTDPDGDTGQLLKNLGYEDIAALEDPDSVRKVLRDHIEKLRSGASDVRAGSEEDLLSRKSRTSQLADVLDSLN